MILVNELRQENKNKLKDLKITKEEIKLSLFTEDMIVLIENQQ